MTATEYQRHSIQGLGLEKVIKQKVEGHYQRHGKLPLSVCVRTCCYDEAAEAMKALGLSIPLEHNGGPLADEVWLGVA